MKLYLKQKVFSLKDQFYITDSRENIQYSVQGEIFSMGKRLHIYDSKSNEIGLLKQKLWSFLPRFEVFIDGEKIAEVNRKLSFVPKYSVDGPKWNVIGDFWAHNYEISQNGESIVQVRKKIFSWADTYELDIKEPKDEILALCVVLAIDADIETHSHSN